MRGLSRHPSGPLPSVDILEAGRVDARRLLRPPPLAASPHHGVLTLPQVVATAARGTAIPLARSTRDRSAPAAIAGGRGCQRLAVPVPCVASGWGNGRRKEVCGKQKLE